MYQRLYPLLFFVLLAFAACKKKDYPESILLNAPEFYAALQFENSSISMEAGKNNYRLFSSFAQDNTGLYRYISELKTESCGSICPNSLRFELLDNKISAPGAPSRVDTLLKAGLYPYSSRSWKVSFESAFNKTAQSYLWSFGDGQESDLKDPEHVYKESGTYQVCLKIISANGCESSICNSIDVGYPPDNCSASITAAASGSSSITFSAQVSGQAPFTYYWDFGDGQFSTLAQPSHHYSVKGAYAVQLTVKDNKGDISINRHHVITPGDQSSCATNFTVKNMQPEDNAFAFSTVKLSYVDAGGNLFESSAYEQDAGSRFEILSVDDYADNERGEPTKKLKVKFNARLYNGTNSLILKPSEAVFCISYKK